MQNLMRNTISLKQKIQSLFLTFLPLGSCGELMTDTARQGAITPEGWVVKGAGWLPDSGVAWPWCDAAHSRPRANNTPVWFWSS